MKLLIFDLRSPLAHYRRPDTTSTHATYPFIPRTALRGLLASVMGLDMWPEEGWTGLELLNPIQTRVQQLSLLGGFLESGKMFNRPTTVELVINPHYRVYYAGALVEELSDRIRMRQSMYHTYLGSAFALCVPEFINLTEREVLTQSDVSKELNVKGIVPVHCVASFAPEAPRRFARAGGMLYRALPNRRFQGTINFIYETTNRFFKICVNDDISIPSVYFVKNEDTSYVALW